MKTRRQELRGSLEEQAIDFEDLRSLFGLPVKVLEDDLRHLAKSLRSEGRRLVVEPPVCRSCGFELEGRRGRYSTPGRCPRCKDHRISPTVLSIE